MLRKGYVAIAKRAQKKKHALFVDLTVTSFATYLGLKKTFDWSMTTWLELLFKPAGAEWIIGVLVVLCIYAAVAKLFLMVVMAYPGTRVVRTDYGALTQCLITLNREIVQHLSNIWTDPHNVASNFVQNQSFRTNVAYSVENLARHMRSTLTGAREEDIFVSVYCVPDFPNLVAPRTCSLSAISSNISS